MPCPELKDCPEIPSLTLRYFRLFESMSGSCAAGGSVVVAVPPSCWGFWLTVSEVINKYILVLFYLHTSPGHHRLNLFAPKPWSCYTDVSIITLEQTPFLNYTLCLSDLTWNKQPLLQPIILTIWRSLP